MLPALKSTFREASYFMIWRRKFKAFVPLASDPGAPSFGEMFNDPYVLTVDEIAP